MRLVDIKQVASAIGLCGTRVALLAVLISPAVSTAGPGIEQRIERIQDGLLPPVLGEKEGLDSTPHRHLAIVEFADLQSELRKATKSCFCSSVKFIWKR